jgi:RimJ/RimL family protein N-acetyltransferase
MGLVDVPPRREDQRRSVSCDRGGSPEARRASDVSGPPLQGRRVMLRPIAVTDHAWLYGLSTHEQVGFRWRYRGATPSPDVFVRTLWEQILAQFVVARRSTNEVVGLVAAYAADLHDRHVQVAAILDPRVHTRGWPLEAMVLFVNYLFTNWDFRKVYAEAVEFNYRQFASGAGRLFSVEAQLRGHHYWNGAFWDQVIGSCTREEWEQSRTRLLRFAIGSSAGRICGNEENNAPLTGLLSSAGL